MTLFNQKYRIESARLAGWNYGADAGYFITICTKNRIPFFGKIESGQIALNEIGKIVHHEWLKSAEIRPDMNLILDDFIVMPNHFHAIIFIGTNAYNNPSTEMQQHVSLPAINKFRPPSKNLSAIVRGFKSSVTKRANRIIPDFAWQERFHDHIIRNEESYFRIKNYIATNPANWVNDKFHVVF